MTLRAWVTFGVLAGSTIGGYIPVLWGDQSMFSIASILCGTVGGLVGVWFGYVAYEYFS